MENEKIFALDDVDKEILHIIQQYFPISSHPYEKIGQVIGISGEEVIHRLRRMKEIGILYRIAAVIDTSKIGYHNMLVAMYVPREQIDHVINIINDYPGVSYNYLRDHPYNIWFTLSGPSNEENNRIVDEISRRTNVKNIVKLPEIKTGKVDVSFDTY